MTDSGTYGYKFTVQPGNGETFRLWNERIAATYGFDTSCPSYSYDGSSFSDTSQSTGCTNYAVAGSVINNYQPASGTVDETTPASIIKQLTDAASDGFDKTGLVLVGGDSGANDAAAMITYFLYAAQGSTTYQQYFAGRVLSIVPSATAYPYLSQGDLVTAGGLYMTALADKLAAAVEADVLDAGVSHVVIQNVLDVTKTPRFQTVLASLDTETATTVTEVAEGWIEAFNNELETQLGGDSRVVIVDFYTHFNDEMADPAQYGLTNVSEPVCDLIDQDISTCTTTDLEATIPSGESSSDWWKTYVFANDFHPTPYGHQLLAEMVTDALSKAGWL
nr:SGNH/GDSL hydrolase family protein [Solimonas marina]